MIPRAIGGSSRKWRDLPGPRCVRSFQGSSLLFAHAHAFWDPRCSFFSFDDTIAQILSIDSAVYIVCLLQVLPYCLFNVFLMILATWVDDHNTQSWKLKISSQGHSFITLVVSFLLVSRVNTCLTRYNEARGYIGLMYQHVREVVQDSCVFSRSSSANPTTTETTTTTPQQWRHDVAYQAIVLLRTAMVVIDYPADKLLPWNIPELNGAERGMILNDGFLNPANLRYSHTAATPPPAHRHDDWEEAMRVPIRLSYALRKTIQTQSTILTPAIAVVQENRLHASVDAIMNGYYGLLKFLTTPVPFPLIQVR
jgi:hypothetical protein